MNTVVVDSNTVYQCLGFLQRLSSYGVRIIIPKAVREELSGAAAKALDEIKKGSKERKWRSAMKTWPVVQEFLESGVWKEAGSSGTGWIHDLAKIFGFTLPSHIPATHIKSFHDLRVLATCIALKEGEPDSTIQLLTYDKYVRQRIFWLKKQWPEEQRFDIIVPGLYFNRRERRMEFDINEVLDPVIKKFPKEVQDVGQP